MAKARLERCSFRVETDLGGVDTSYQHQTRNWTLQGIPPLGLQQMYHVASLWSHKCVPKSMRVLYPKGMRRPNCEGDRRQLNMQPMLNTPVVANVCFPMCIPARDMRGGLTRPGSAFRAGNTSNLRSCDRWGRWGILGGCNILSLPRILPFFGTYGYAATIVLAYNWFYGGLRACGVCHAACDVILLLRRSPATARHAGASGGRSVFHIRDMHHILSSMSPLCHFDGDVRRCVCM